MSKVASSSRLFCLSNNPKPKELKNLELTNRPIKDFSWSNNLNDLLIIKIVADDLGLINLLTNLFALVALQLKLELQLTIIFTTDI